MEGSIASRWLLTKPLLANLFAIRKHMGNRGAGEVDESKEEVGSLGESSPADVTRSPQKLVASCPSPASVSSTAECYSKVSRAGSCSAALSAKNLR